MEKYKGKEKESITATFWIFFLNICSDYVGRNSDVLARAPS